VNFLDTLTTLTRIPGVRGAMVVSREDGLVVAESLMDSMDGAAVAALAASLTDRMRGVTAALGQPEGLLVHLGGSEGALLTAPAPGGLLLVAIAASDVNAGELRLGLLAAAAAVA
jgi:predicted regulator of Ras-like GTPase activity (Roadblock/LC7/MglB family)